MAAVQAWASQKRCMVTDLQPDIKWQSDENHVVLLALKGNYDEMLVKLRINLGLIN